MEYDRPIIWVMIVLRAASLVNELRCEIWHLRLDQCAEDVTTPRLISRMAAHIHSRHIRLSCNEIASGRRLLYLFR